MVLERARLQNFRNHSETNLNFSRNGNILVGFNGEGKTNILEAISYLCLSRGFVSGNDAAAVQLGHPAFALDGEFVTDSGRPFSVKLRYDQTESKKEITINKAEIERLSEIVGLFPLVTLAPVHNAITIGAPSERRRFLDLLISQSSKTYLNALMEYRQVLRQRNKLLLDIKLNRRAKDIGLEPWSERLAQGGTKVLEKRLNFIDEFQPFILNAYMAVTGEKEQPGVEYQSTVPTRKEANGQEIFEMFQSVLAENEQAERRTGTTLVGPHRDELKLSINDLDLRTYASQGQHKTFLVALKIAEFRYLEQQRRETPMLLLDDVFSELDESRTARIVGMFDSLGQAFITSVDEKPLPTDYFLSPNHHRYIVERGTVRTTDEQTVGNEAIR